MMKKYRDISISNWDIVWSYLGVLASLGSNILIIPFILNYLDSDSIGIWYIFLSIGNLAYLFDCGFCVTFSRYITYSWSGSKCISRFGVADKGSGEPNFYLLKKILQTSKLIYVVISISVTASLLIMGTQYISKVVGNVESNVYNSIMIAWYIYCIAVFLNLYFGYYNAFLRGVGAIKIANQNMVIARLVHVGVTIFTINIGLGLIGTSLGYCAYGIFCSILGNKRFYHYSSIGENLKRISEKVSFSDIKELFFVVWYNAWRDGLISLTNYCTSHLSTLICSFYLTLHETGVYSLGLQFSSAIGLFSSVLYSTYQPAIQQDYVTQNYNNIREKISTIIISYLYIFIISVIITIYIVFPILKFIRPSSVMDNFTFLLLCLYQFIIGFRNIYTTYFSCTNRIIYLKAFVITSIFSLIFSYISLDFFRLGIFGLIVSQILSQIIYNAWYWPYLGNSELKLSKNDIFILGNSILKKKIQDILNVHV